MTHEESRQKVCLTCFHKTTENLDSATPLVLQRLNDHVMQHLDVNDFRVPKGFCSCCRRKLEKISTSGEKPFDLQPLHEYLQEQKRISPREKHCDCFVCQIAASKGGKS